MAEIEFSAAEKAVIVKKIQLYFRDELDQQIGGFDAEFLLDFFAQEIGAYFYNRGVYDAQALVAQQLEAIGDSLYQLEKPTGFAR